MDNLKTLFQKYVHSGMYFNAMNFETLLSCPSDSFFEFFKIRLRKF